MSDTRDIAVSGEGQQPKRAVRRPVVAPAVDIYESAEQVVLVADLPGVGPGEVMVSFEKDELRIEATTRAVGEGLSPLFREFTQRDYRRAFHLAPGIDVDGITAEQKGGVLTVRLPKASALKPRQITIQAG